jgi:hypothetical protein
MKLTTIALATAFALSSTFALAQAGTGSGATVPEKSGASVNGGGGVVGETGKPSDDAAMQKSQGTTGTSRQPSAAGDASTSGAGTAAGPNSTGARAEPGAVQGGTNGR